MLAILFHFHLKMGASPSPAQRWLGITVAVQALMAVTVGEVAPLYPVSVAAAPLEAVTVAGGTGELTVTVAAAPLHTVTVDVDEV